MAKTRRIFQLLVTTGMIAIFIGCAATQPQKVTGQYTDDSIITAKVKASLFDEPSLNTLPIKVSTDRAIVKLSGFVDSPQSVTKAGEVAGRIDGVVSVTNDLGMSY